MRLRSLATVLAATGLALVGLPATAAHAATPTVSGVLLQPASVPAGLAVTGWVLLSGPAGPGGLTVPVTSDDRSVASVPESVLVPQGNTAAMVTVSPLAPGTATISATSAGVTKGAELTVTPAGLGVASLTLDPAEIEGGTAGQATVTLTGPAPAGGAAVAISRSIWWFVEVPTSVTVPEGETATTFSVSTHEVTSPLAVTLTASYGGYEDSATLTIVLGDGVVLESLAISPDQVVGGNPAQGTVSLAQPVDEPVAVSLSSTSGVATVPASVTIPAGSTAASFPIATRQVSGSDFAWIEASTAGQSRGASINLVRPAPWNLEEVTVSPSTVVGGGPATGRLQFDRVTDGVAVTLTSSRPDIVTVSGASGTTTAAVRPGLASDLFPVSTEPVTEPVEVTITATYWFGTTETTTITVVPGTPPPPDRVRIRDADWDRCIIEFEATSSHPDVIMTVHSATSGGFVMRLMPDRDGRYSGEKALRPPGTGVPVAFEVRSHLGGVDTVTLADPRGGACRADL